MMFPVLFRLSKKIWKGRAGPNQRLSIAVNFGVLGLFFSFFFLLVAGFLHDDTLRVTGRIQLAGEPLAGAVVEVPGLEGLALTDDEGAFFLQQKASEPLVKAIRIRFRQIDSTVLLQDWSVPVNVYLPDTVDILTAEQCLVLLQNAQMEAEALFWLRWEKKRDDQLSTIARPGEQRVFEVAARDQFPGLGTSEEPWLSKRTIFTDDSTPLAASRKYEAFNALPLLITVDSLERMGKDQYQLKASYRQTLRYVRWQPEVEAPLNWVIWRYPVSQWREAVWRNRKWVLAPKAVIAPI